MLPSVALSFAGFMIAISISFLFSLIVVNVLFFLFGLIRDENTFFNIQSNNPYEHLMSQV